MTTMPAAARAVATENAAVPGNPLARIGTYAAALGGLGLIAHYLLHLGFGLATNRVLFDANESPWLRVNIGVFFGFYAALAVALFGLRARFGGRLRAVTVPAGILSGIALLAALAGLSLLFRPDIKAAFGDPLLGKAGPTGILSLFLSSILLGSAGWKSGILPRSVSVVVLLFGLITMPLAFALSTLEKTFPPYTVMELHFTVSGTLWLLTARGLARE
jgi:hypothetical protein